MDPLSVIAITSVSSRSHSDKAAKEAQRSYKQLNRKGDSARSPLDRICSIGHKNFNQILMLMANTMSAFRTTECTGRLLMSDKIMTYNKAHKVKVPATPIASIKGTVSGHVDSAASSPYNLPASAGESHPNFKTAMCRYGDRCIYGERCSFAHSESELRIPSYAVSNAPSEPDSNTDFVSSVSLGPGGGPSVAVVSPVANPVINESFVMQNDDFPGLPGSLREAQSAPPRTAAAIAGGNGYFNKAPSDIRPQQSTTPTNEYSRAVGESSGSDYASIDYRPRSAALQPDAFQFSEFKKFVSESSYPGQFNSARGGTERNTTLPFAAGGILDTSAGLLQSNDHFQRNPQNDLIGSHHAFGLGTDIIPVSSLGGSMFNPAKSGYGKSFMVEQSLQSVPIIGSDIGPSTYDKSEPPSDVYRGTELNQGSRFDVFANQQPFLRQQASALKGVALPIPPSVERQEMQQKIYLTPQQLRQQQLQELRLQEQRVQIQQQQMYAAHTAAPPAGAGIDADLVPLNTFATVDWLRSSDMGIFRWSGNDRAWTEFAMHVPANFHSFFSSNLPAWQQHSNCNMWFDTDKLRGETQRFLVFRRGENGEESNNAMQRALELISHHLSFILVKNDAPKSGLQTQASPMW